MHPSISLYSVSVVHIEQIITKLFSDTVKYLLETREHSQRYIHREKLWKYSFGLLSAYSAGMVAADEGHYHIHRGSLRAGDNNLGRPGGMVRRSYSTGPNRIICAADGRQRQTQEASGKDLPQSLLQRTQ